MTTPAYIWIKDEQGNLLKGNSQIEGREDSTVIYELNHEIYIPTDRDTGVLTGTRKHAPLTFTKSLCPLTPILNKACCSGKTFQEMQISWFHIDNSGNESEYFRHTLTNVRVVAVKPQLLHIKNEKNDRHTHEEQISVRYEKIQWEYLDGNIIADDEWNRKSAM